MFLFISGAEIFIIFVIIVMLFGADKIPEIARGLGKGMQQLKQATNEVKKEITDSGVNTDFTKDIQNEVKKIKNKIQDNIEEATGLNDEIDLTKNIKKEVDKVTNIKSKVQDNFEDLTGPIKRNL